MSETKVLDESLPETPVLFPTVYGFGGNLLTSYS
jgi:hypothetical protein